MYSIDIKSTLGYGVYKGVKILCYGDAGTGKTSLCATAPSPLILSAEGGLLTLRNFNLPFIEVQSVDQLKIVWKWLQTPDADWVKTVCLDSISEIAEVLLNELIKVEKDGRRYWSMHRQQVVDVIKCYRDLPGKNVFMTSKEEKIKTDTGIKYACAMPGNKLGPDMPYLFDEVFRLGVGTADKTTYRYLITQPTPDSVAKDRSNALAPVEVNPDLSSIIAKIQGGHNG